MVRNKKAHWLQKIPSLVWIVTIIVLLLNIASWTLIFVFYEELASYFSTPLSKITLIMTAEILSLVVALHLSLSYLLPSSLRNCRGSQRLLRAMIFVSPGAPWLFYAIQSFILKVDANTLQITLQQTGWSSVVTLIASIAGLIYYDRRYDELMQCPWAHVVPGH